MWDIMPLLRCPYCHSNLQGLKCIGCDRQYFEDDGIFYMYDPREPHWKNCTDQIKALFRLDYRDDWQPRHDDPSYPYNGIDAAGLAQKANAAMFNVAKDLIGELMFTRGYGLDIGAYNGWASCQLAKHKLTVSVDTSDHKCYGLGDVPQNIGFGIRKVIADGCYLPFGEDVFDIVFMASSLHHMHDKRKSINEAYRVLKPNGKYVAIGDRWVSENQIEEFMNDGIRDYEGLPYTKEQFTSWLRSSMFKSIEIIPIKYSENMYKLGYFSLAKEPEDNIIVYGVKN